MITRLFNSRLPLMVYNPARVFSLDFFINAYRAGALPVFDTEFLLDHAILDGIKRLATANILFGVRVVEPSQTLLSKIKALDLTRLNCLVIPFARNDNPAELKENLDGFLRQRLSLKSGKSP